MRPVQKPGLRRPSLWRRLVGRGRLFPRKLTFTREGRYLLMLSLGVGFAAINTGNNLLYLVFGMLISLIVVSGVLSELTLRKIEVSADIPRELHARRRTLCRVKIRNGKRRLASYSLEAELVSDDPRVTQRSAHVIVLRAGEESEANLDISFEERGRYSFPGLRLATRYPFGFFRKSRFFSGEVELIAYPAVVDVPAPRIESARPGVETMRPKSGRGADYYGLRELRAGDDLRDVYWKASAKSGALVVREYEEPVRRQVTLCLPNVTPDERPETLAAVERAVDAAGSLALRLAEDGSDVGLVTADAAIAPGSGQRHIQGLLRQLALMDLYTLEDGERVALHVRGDSLLVRHSIQRELRVDGGHRAVAEVTNGEGG